MKRCRWCSSVKPDGSELTIWFVCENVLCQALEHANKHLGRTGLCPCCLQSPCVHPEGTSASMLTCKRCGVNGGVGMNDEWLCPPCTMIGFCQKCCQDPCRCSPRPTVDQKLDLSHTAQIVFRAEYDVGEKVLIGTIGEVKPIAANVIEVKFSGNRNRVLYNVAWWNGRVRQEMWVEDFELKKAGT